MRKFTVFCIILAIAIYLPATASATDEFAKVEITDNGYYESLTILDPQEYWIEILGGGNKVVMPDLTFIYNGFNTTDYPHNGKHVSVTIYGVNRSEDYEVEYPPDEDSRKDFRFPFYYRDDNVTAKLYDSAAQPENDTYVYLVRTSFEDFKRSVNSALEGDTGPIRDLLNNSVDVNQTVSTAAVEFGELPPGDYMVVATLNESSGDNIGENITLLSATPFQVLEHKSTLTVPKVVKRESNSQIVDVEGTFTINGSSNANYTYLAVLIKKEDYSLDIRAESNGTSATTDLSINGAQVVQSWKIGGVGQKNINSTTVYNWIEEAFKDDPVSITLLKNDNSIEFTLTIDDDFGDGDYYLNVGAWNNSNSSQKLVAFDQDVIKVNTAPPTQPDTGRRGGGGGGGGGGVSVPPPLQAGSAILYTSFHTLSDTESIITIPSTYVSETGVTRLKGKTTSSIFVSFAVSGVSELPPNIPQPDSDVYRTFEIVFTEFNTANEVEPSGTIEFKVSKDWIDEKGYDPEDIVLLKYREEWQELQTELVDEDEDYYYYEATVDSFSIFAISGATRTNISPPPIQPTTPTPQPEPTTTEQPPETPEPETTPDEGSFWSNNIPLVVIIINAVVIGIVALIIYFKRI